MIDKNLICSFGWKRKDLATKSLNSLLLNKRNQDKLLIIDQEMQNWDLYQKHRKHIDFLYFLKSNYGIGPIWKLIEQTVNFQMAFKDSKARRNDVNCSAYNHKNWIPDFVNIIESDAIGQKNWINDVVKIFDVSNDIGIATGYDGIEHAVIKKIKNVKIKDITPGVQMMFKTNHFLQIMNEVKSMPMKSHDWLISETNKKLGKTIGVINKIKHIG